MDILKHWMMVASKLALAVSGLFIFRNYGPNLCDEKMVEIAGAIANVAGVLLGFLLTAITLIAAVMDRRLVATMRKSGHLKILSSDTFYACSLLLITLVNGLVCLFFDGWALEYSFQFLVFMSLLSMMYVVQSGIRFRNVFIVLS